MEHTTTGLILRTRPLTESSLIVSWITRDFGRISTVAKGARRIKSPLLGKLDQFFLADLSFHWSKRSELHTLREVQVREHNSALRTDLGRLSQAAYFAQLLELTTEPSTPLPGMLELMSAVLESVSSRPQLPLTLFAFEIKLLGALGLKPDLDQSSLTPGARAVLERLESPGWEILSHLKISDAQENEIGTFLQRFILYHFGKVPKARELGLRMASQPTAGSASAN